MRLTLLFILLFSVYSDLSSQNTVGTISVTDDVLDGFTLFTVNKKSFLINNCGEVINEWTSTYNPGNAVYLLPNGNLLRAGRTDDGSSNIAFGGQGGVVELFDWNNTLLWTFTYSTNSFRLHHDVYPLPNGNVLVLAAEVMTQSEAIAAGRDPNNLASGNLYNERIIELQPIGSNSANIVWDWNAKDHLIQDFDNTKANFGDVAANPQRIDFNFLNGGGGGNNWLHVNSIQYDELRDQIVISTRNLSELWIIDHSTTMAESAGSTGGTYGRGGDLLYRWGNPIAYQQGTTNDQKLFGQHFPHFIESGLPNEQKLIIFNNGLNRTPEFSQVDIITPPETSLGVYTLNANQAYGPTNTDYTYTSPDQSVFDFYSSVVSSAQQLPNGNILICEGREGFIFEIDNNDNIVWEYRVPVNGNTGAIYTQGTSPIGNLIFRATKYTPSYSAFNGRDLTPSNPIEFNPNLTPCNNLSLDEFAFDDIKLFPNPTKSRVEIVSNTVINKVEVFSSLGQKVAVSNSNIIDLSNNPNGLYIVKVYSENNILVRKIIKS